MSHTRFICTILLYEPQLTLFYKPLYFFQKVEQFSFLDNLFRLKGIFLILIRFKKKKVSETDHKTVF